MNTTLQDLRFAVRSLWHAPGFTVVAVLTLALGIGANTAIFSVVDGVLLRPTPFTDPARLAMVWETDRKSGTTREPASIPDFLDFQQRSGRFQQLAAFAAQEVSLAPEGSDALRVPALAVGHGFLPMLGVQPLLGRGFTDQEDRPGGPRVALIAEALWEQLFARNPDAVGRSLRIDDLNYTIIGVLPGSADFGTLQLLNAAAYSRGFADRGGQARVQAWLPLQPDPTENPRRTHPIFVVGRLTGEASLSQAQQEMTGIASDLERSYPENDARGVFVESLSQVVFGPVRPALLVLLGAVALVLLVACANVANLLLARGAGRIREVTVRAALGATPRRLLRQFVVESAVLTTVSTVVGVALAFGLLDLLLAIAPSTIPRVGQVGLDMGVLGATLSVTVVVALLFGILPSVQARRFALQPSLQGDSGRGSTAGRSHHRFRSGLVIVELALAVMLLVGAGLLIKSLWRLEQVDPGFHASGILKAEFQLPESRYPRNFSKWPHWIEIQRFNDELRRQVAALPGVEAVTIAGNHPLETGFTSSIVVAGREGEAADWPEPSIRQIDSGYLKTLGVSLDDGRGLEASDDADGVPVVLINQAARRAFFANTNPLGEKIRLWGVERMVVGVIGNERMHGLAETTPPAIYLPQPQAPASGGSLLVRVRGTPESLSSAIRSVVRQLDPSLPLFGIEPLSQTVANSTGQQRFTTIVLGLFAAVALLLAIVGVQGVLSYTVAQRTREIGIRMALGADRPAVRRLILGQGARLTGAGVGLGLIGAVAISRVLASLLFGVSTADPATFVGVALLLGSVALVASYLPARRAARTDPVIAFRSE